MKKEILLLLVLLQIHPGICLSQSDGPRNAMSATYSAMGCLACPGGEWQNLANISHPDHVYTDVLLASYPMCFQTTCYYSRTLYASDFGFSIPAGAQIRGVVADVLRKSTAGTGVSDSSVTLYTGNPVGTNHASPLFWTPNPMVVTYGDSTDTWNHTLTPDTINTPNFGLSMIVMNRNLNTAFSTASVDHVAMTVYYSTGTGIESQTRTAAALTVHYNKSNSELDLNFSADPEINSLSVFNAIGNKIFSVPSISRNKRNMTFVLPLLQHGIYFIVIGLNGKTVTRKFVAK